MRSCSSPRSWIFLLYCLRFSPLIFSERAISTWTASGGPYSRTMAFTTRRSSCMVALTTGLGRSASGPLRIIESDGSLSNRRR